MVYSTAENFLQPWITTVGIERHWLFWKRPIYRTVEDYTFEWGPQGGRKRIWCKKGTEYNLASTPPFGEVLGFNANGESDAGSLFHDRFGRNRITTNRYGFTPGEFEFQTQLPTGEWTTDLSPWKEREIQNLYEYMCRLGGMGKFSAWLEKLTVTIAMN